MGHGLVSVQTPDVEGSGWRGHANDGLRGLRACFNGNTAHYRSNLNAAAITSSRPQIVEADHLRRRQRYHAKRTNGTRYHARSEVPENGHSLDFNFPARLEILRRCEAASGNVDATRGVLHNQIAVDSFAYIGRDSPDPHGFPSLKRRIVKPQHLSNRTQRLNFLRGRIPCDY
jgi:hypothetical protein